MIKLWRALYSHFQLFRFTRSMTEAAAPPAKRFCAEDRGSNEAMEGTENAPNSEIAEDITKESEVTESGMSGKKCHAKKCALLLSYSGKGYLGMQWNPGVRTIEHDLIKAISDADAVPEHAKGNPGKLFFQRCARTDKGVSAARQLVSLKMYPLERYVEEINRHLPPEIRVIALKRVTKGFTSNGVQACSARSYEYVLPTFAFAPYHATRLDYRITDQVVDKVNMFLHQYEGTHNFHNFTSGKDFVETSSKRYIMSFKCGNRFLSSAECDECPQKREVEFMSLHVKGQSFMLHQIRKMIGLLIAVVKGYIPEDSITRAYAVHKAEMPKAPGIGLLLDNVHFELYNKRFATDGMHPMLDWTEYEEQIQAFKRDYIYKTIIETEIKELSMMQWLNSLLKHDFAYFLKPQQSQVSSAPQPPTSVISQVPSETCDMQQSQVSMSCDMQSQAPMSCDMQQSQVSMSCDMQSQASMSCDVQQSQDSMSCDTQSQASKSCDMQSQTYGMTQTQDPASCDTQQDHSPAAPILGDVPVTSHDVQDQTVVSEKSVSF